MKYINLSRVKIYTVLRNYFNSIEIFFKIKQVLLQNFGGTGTIKLNHRHQQNKKEFWEKMKKIISGESFTQNNREW